MKSFLVRTASVLVLLGALSGTAFAQSNNAGYAGLTIGTPGLINLNAGYYTQYFGGRGSLCFLNVIEFMDDEEDPTYDDSEEPWMFAMQLNFDFALIHNEHFLLTIGLVGGIFYAEEQYAEEDVFSLYGGFALGIVIGGFFIEAGVAWLSDYDANMFYYDENWIPLIQVGYLHRF